MLSCLLHNDGRAVLEEGAHVDELAMLKHDHPSALPVSGPVQSASPAGRFVPALGWRWLTPLYDGLLRLGGREQAFKARLIAQARIQPAETILDLGCGTGTLAIELKRRKPSAYVVGLDCDPDMLNRAQAKAKRARIQVRFDEALSWNLPYPDATFDVVLSSLFFHHLDGPGLSRTLAEVARVLRPGGRLHVADWGRQGSLLMTALSFPDRLLDGLERTAGAFAGQLPSEMAAAGLGPVTEAGGMDTGFGRLTFYTARAPMSRSALPASQPIPDSAP